ncbi:MAG: hypothetical protein KDJ44_02395 [Rhodoblastus sp.]|nr:hypothetical protein [Rhodoblastus sp.]
MKEKTEMVRCKFIVTAINHIHLGHHPTQKDLFCAEVTLAPVWEENGVNRQWSKATPQGQIKMTITNKKAFEQFELGGFYFVDFTPTTFDAA